MGFVLHHHHLNIHQREREGIVILDLDGRLVMGGGDIALRDFVQALLDGGNRQLILDLVKVFEIDTAGNGVLLLLAQQYRDAGGKLVALQHRSLAWQAVRNGALGNGRRNLSR